jgi:hypothetical protein
VGFCLSPVIDCDGVPTFAAEWPAVPSAFIDLLSEIRKPPFQYDFKAIQQ